MAIYIKTLDGQKHTIGLVRTAIPCFRCGLCCINFLVKLTSNEFKVLAHRLGVSNRDLLRKYVKKTTIGYALRQNGNRCVFLTYDGTETIAKCSIYAFRPVPCRNWIPSLSCPQCQEGLRKLGKDNELLLPSKIYQSEDDTAKLYSRIEIDSAVRKVG